MTVQKTKQATTYRGKLQSGDVIGLYKIIKPLPYAPNVTNMKFYCECLQCGAKCVRFSNRLNSRHKGCTAPKTYTPQGKEIVMVHPHTPAAQVGIEQQPAPQRVEDLPIIDDDSPEDFHVPKTMKLPKEVADYFNNQNIDEQAIEILEMAKQYDIGRNFLFTNTFQRFMTLLHLSRKLGRAVSDDGMNMVVEGQRGKMIANPLMAQYKQISAEMTSTTRILIDIIDKMKNKAEEDEDPLTKALLGKRNERG
jgi:hypothetical protein